LKDVFALQLSRSNTVSRDKALAVRRLKGNGTATTRRGREIPVEYHLCFPQHPADTSDDPSHAPLQEFSGQVWCPYDGSFVSVHFGKILTLRLEDGRQLRFCHQDRDGGITVTEWIG
jgi:hypothetical protein